MKNELILKKGKIIGGTKERDIIIISKIMEGKATYYNYYDVEGGFSDTTRDHNIKVLGDVFEKKSTEVYSWDIFKPEDRIKRDYLDSIEDYNNMEETKEDLILLLLQYDTALKRIEEIVKRSLGLDEVEEEVPAVFITEDTLAPDFPKLIKKGKYFNTLHDNMPDVKGFKEYLKEVRDLKVKSNVEEADSWKFANNEDVEF